MAESKLQFRKDNDKAYFYYGETAVFQSSQSMPFIVLKKLKNGANTTVSLYKCEVEKKENVIEATFYEEDKKAKLILKENNNKVGFVIECDEEYDELCFTLQKNGVKVYGLPAYKQKKYNPTFWDRLFKRQQKIIELDKKLSFYLSGIYLFENVNITDYVFENKDNIFIRTQIKNPSFNLVFADDIMDAIKSLENFNLKIKQYKAGSVFIKQNKYNPEKIEEFCKTYKKEIKGVIINKRLFDPSFIKPETVRGQKKNLDVIYSLDKVISLKTAKRYFDASEYETISATECEVNLSTEEAIRKYLVVIRKYLDLGASGIYFDGDFTHEEILNIKEGMKAVIKEYIDCAVLHSVITESSDDFGYFIIKNKDVLDNFHDYSRYYLYSNEIKIGKEENKIDISKEFYINIIDLDNLKIEEKRKKFGKNKKK